MSGVEIQRDNRQPCSGHAEARRLYPNAACEKCGKPSIDRHHIDGNPLNNHRSNIMILCRSCHFKEDHRMERIRLMPVPLRIRSPRSKTGFCNVYKGRGRTYWSGFFKNGKRVYLGNFPTPEEASAAYVEAATKFRKGETHDWNPRDRNR